MTLRRLACRILGHKWVSRIHLTRANVSTTDWVKAHTHHSCQRCGKTTP